MEPLNRYLEIALGWMKVEQLNLNPDKAVRVNKQELDSDTMAVLWVRKLAIVDGVMMPGLDALHSP